MAQFTWFVEIETRQQVPQVTSSGRGGFAPPTGGLLQADLITCEWAELLPALPGLAVACVGASVLEAAPAPPGTWSHAFPG